MIAALHHKKSLGRANGALPASDGIHNMSRMLSGRMMQTPLTLNYLLSRMRQNFSGSEVIWKLPDGTIRRRSFGDTVGRALRLAHALEKMGVKPGARVATLSWSHAQHFEVYLGVPAIGAVVHTLNMRLHPHELAYIARHAEDEVLIVDRSNMPLWEKFRDQTPGIRHVIVIPDDGEVTPSMGVDYEALIENTKEEAKPKEVPENSAAMICYTSGTTGNPKGVVYSHRSCMIHTLVSCMKDSANIGESDVILPVVQLFHAAAWGLPYSAALSGANLVLPGRHLDDTTILNLISSEKVSITAGVPTVWLPILHTLDQNPGKYDTKRWTTLLCGGSAAPPSMIEGFRERHGVEVIHLWGMTEMNPIGTLARLKTTIPPEDAERTRHSQGAPIAMVEIRHRSEDGTVLPWDGSTMGELEVRGPFVAGSYYGDEGNDKFTDDGWFRTGDVVTIDSYGYIRITDRSKDVIKSGGEWISSVALENALMGHPAVMEAAVFAAVHPQWDERPVAAIVLKANQKVTEDELKKHLAPYFAKYWLPDRFLFLHEIPRTSTGKFLKSRLRADYGNCLVQT